MCELEKGDYFIIKAEKIPPSLYQHVQYDQTKSYSTDLIDTVASVWVDKWGHTVWQVIAIGEGLIQAQAILSNDTILENTTKRVLFRKENIRFEILSKEFVTDLAR